MSHGIAKKIIKFGIDKNGDNINIKFVESEYYTSRYFSSYNRCVQTHLSVSVSRGRENSQCIRMVIQRI